MDKRFGRILNPNTMDYESDGIPPLPKEVAVRFDSYAEKSRDGISGAGLCAIGLLMKWNDDYKKRN